MPDLDEAWGELEGVARTSDRLKLVVQARSGEDGVRVLESVRERKRDVIGFASGSPGSFTRVVAPVFGSAWTYAAPASVGGDVGLPSAPGQLRADELRAMWPGNGVTRETRVLAVLGRPAVHSLSPRVHGAALRAAGVDAVYVAIEPEDLEVFLGVCRSPAWSGFSVTAPFKGDAFARAGVRDPRSKSAQAANTLVRASDGMWSAHNTDVPALAAVVGHALERGGRGIAGARALVVGTGGSARAALVALKGAVVTVAGRDAAVRTELAREFRCASVGLDELAGGSWDVIVHCTPAGSHAQPGGMAVDARALREGTVVVDAVYRPVRTPLLIEVERAGAIAVSGAEWFLRQAALQFELFTGRDCDEQAMRAELERALAEDAR
jgi:3-dehydroquinate dehydratase/shikimate dehydrogenase